ncbi:MAG: MltR family transcriptional regulator [Lutibacter sp.]
MKKSDLEFITTTLIFQNELKEGSDRVCLLMAASFLESELERDLKIKLVGDPVFKYDLFDYKGPLGDLTSKARMSYGLGIISEKMMANLILIDGLKNEFMRDYKATTFEDPLVTQQIYNLTAGLYLKYEAPPRRYFCNAALTTLSFIFAGLSVKKFKEKIHPKFSESERNEKVKYIEAIADQVIFANNKN